MDSTFTNSTQVEQALLTWGYDDTATAIARQVGGGVTPGDVRRHIETDFDLDAFTIEAQATASSRPQARAYAQAFGERFVERQNIAAGAAVREPVERAAERLETAQNRLDEFEATHAQELRTGTPSPTTAAAYDQLVEERSKAIEALTTARSDPSTTAGTHYKLVAVSSPRAVERSSVESLAQSPLQPASAVAVGLLAALALVIVLELVNPRIDDAETAEALVRAPVLAQVPAFGRSDRRRLDRVDPADFGGAFAEAFRAVRSHLDHRAQSEGLAGPPRIMVTSAVPGEGKSTTSAFLALAYAEEGRRPIVIGGDLRRPAVHRLFAVDRVPGLSNRREAPAPDLGGLLVADPTSGVTVVPSGPSGALADSVATDIAALTEAARLSGRVAILDTPPVQVANDAIRFLPCVDWAILVVRAGRSTQRSVRRMVDTLRQSQAEVAGLVVVGATESADALREFHQHAKPTRRWSAGRTVEAG